MVLREEENRAVRDSTRATVLAQRVLKNDSRYPPELAFLAARVIWDTSSHEEQESFLAAYDQAPLVRRALNISDGLDYPPSEEEYYEPNELNQPGIEIGTEPVHDWPVKYLPQQGMNPIVVISGMSGSGKTTCLAQFAFHLPVADPTASILLDDRHNNFSGLPDIPGQRWLVLDGHELRDVLFDRDQAQTMIQILGENRSLEKSLNNLDDARDRIQRALDALGHTSSSPSLEHVINGLRSLTFRDTKPEYLRSALTEMTGLQRSMPMWNYSRSDMLDKILAPGMHTVVRTSGWDLRNERLFLTRVMSYAIHTGNAGLRDHFVYLLVDELQHLFNRESWSSKALRTQKNDVLHARQPKLVIVGCSQMPATLEPELLASAGLIVCKLLQDTRNIREAAGALGLPLDQASQLLQSLDRSEAVVRSAGRPGPIKIDTPLVRLPRRCDETKRREAAVQFIASCHIDPGVPWEQVYDEIRRQERFKQTVLSALDIQVLREACRTSPTPICLKDLAAKLGASVSEVSKSARTLEKHGYAPRPAAVIDRSRMVFVDPTEQGFQFSGIPKPTGIGGGNAPHRHCVARIERHYRAKGYTANREADRNGKRIDLMLQKGRELIYAEIEMSEKTAARNAAADLATAGPDVQKILIVCPTKGVLRKVEKAVKAAVNPADLKRFAFKILSEF